MSWSVSALGKVAAVRAALATQFSSAKSSTMHIPHEHESVKQVEVIVNGQLDFLAAVEGPVAVRVEASGSAYTYKNGDKLQGSTQVKLLCEPIAGFIE